MTEPGSEDGLLGAGRFLSLERRNGWEFVDRPGVDDVAVIIAVTDDDQAVFVEQYREPVRAKMIEWAAGLVGDEEGDDGEHLLEAAHRELEEETGFRAAKLTVLGRGPSSGGLTTEVVTFLRAEGLQRVGEGGGVGGEEIAVHLVPLAKVDSWLRLREDDGFLIDPKVYAGLYWLEHPKPSRDREEAVSDAAT